MFSGIIKYQSLLIQKTGSCYIFKTSLKGIQESDSINHSGICLTIVNVQEEEFCIYRVDISQETFNRTTVSLWKVGMMVNIEPSLRANSALGGHMVTGHVDCSGTVQKIISHRGSFVLSVQPHDKNCLNLVSPRGSIAIDGVSLTVMDVSSHDIIVTIIPYTFDQTSFKFVREGDCVNIEVDIIARYVARYLKSVSVRV